MPSPKQKSSNKPPSRPKTSPTSTQPYKASAAGVAERRALISYQTAKGPIRKRGLEIDKLIGLTDEGLVVHVPSGFVIPTPRDAGGTHRPVKDLRGWIDHFLAADPQGWNRSRTLPFGKKMSLPLQEQLLAVVESYDGP